MYRRSVPIAFPMRNASSGDNLGPYGAWLRSIIVQVSFELQNLHMKMPRLFETQPQMWLKACGEISETFRPGK